MRHGLFVQLDDGPMAGATFEVPRCPKAVRCVVAIDGQQDILNEPDDAPQLGEVVHWYRWDGRPSGFMCGRQWGRTWVRLVHAPELRELRAPDPYHPAGATA